MKAHLKYIHVQEYMYKHSKKPLGEDLNYDTGQTMLDYATRKTTGTHAQSTC